jgi:hypothetical protein
MTHFCPNGTEEQYQAMLTAGTRPMGFRKGSARTWQGRLTVGT